MSINLEIKLKEAKAIIEELMVFCPCIQRNEAEKFLKEEEQRIDKCNDNEEVITI